jgi:predicted DNA-binding protein (MmcQ/YjbR family)
MTLEGFREICGKLDGVTEDVKWETDYCFCVGGKMFLVACPEERPIPASFKVNEAVFDELLLREGFKPAPYLAKHKWVAVDDIARLNKKEWEGFIAQSYRLVAAKLPKRKR